MKGMIAMIAGAVLVSLYCAPATAQTKLSTAPASMGHVMAMAKRLKVLEAKVEALPTFAQVNGIVTKRTVELSGSTLKGLKTADEKLGAANALSHTRILLLTENAVKTEQNFGGLETRVRKTEEDFLSLETRVVSGELDITKLKEIMGFVKYNKKKDPKNVARVQNLFEKGEWKDN